MLTTALVTMALCAVFFTVFGLYGPARECSGDCGSCTGACPSQGEQS